MESSLKSAKNIHMIGINGSGMSALAYILKQQHENITGSDQSLLGHSAKNLSKKTDLVIYSQAIPTNNPERLEAKKRGIKELSYPQAVGELTAQKKTIAVCGTHGKTTVTAMLSAAFIAAKQDPTIIVGANIKELDNQNSRVGKSEYLILESCEYRRAFLNYHPQIIILNNIEIDHLDYFKNLADYKNAFKEFIKKLPKQGILIANQDDKNVKNICKNLKNVKWFSSKNLHQVPVLKIPGEHNRLNALAVLTLCKALKLNLTKVKAALKNYTGATRRFEFKGKIGKTIIIDDYAHHPTEIKKTLKATREKFGEKAKILCIFQPHQYSRTFKLLKDFAKSFKDADQVIVPNILAVRDSVQDLKKVNEQILVKKIGSKASFGNGLKNTEIKVKAAIKDYDVIITMGAGDVYKIAENLLKSFSK